MKVALIGAGGFVFPFRLIGDLLSSPALQDLDLRLMDIDASRLNRTADAARRLIDHHGLAATVLATTDRRAAIRDADVVIITFQVGGLESYRHDVEIPRRYGVDQTVGDTVGPGGVFRFLRSARVYESIADDVRELCPRATVVNYANPMAMATGYLAHLGLKVVGLCHSVQGTTRMLARTLGVAYDEVDYLCAGINHQAWVLRFVRGDEDLYPRLREVMVERHQRGRGADGLSTDDGDHSGVAESASDYEGGNEQVRTAIMRTFGYFTTESSHHASEYLPYFRRSPELVREYLPRRWDYYEICRAHDESGDIEQQLARLMQKLEPSLEYGAVIVEAIATGRPAVVYGNVPNTTGLIANLPAEACVEVPCLVDGNGVQPTAIGSLPTALAAVNRTNIAVQTLAVEAVVQDDVERVHQAVALDPLTASVLDLDRIRRMTEELLEAHADLLPPALARASRLPTAARAAPPPLQAVPG